MLKTKWEGLFLKMIEKNYSIHDIVTFKIINKTNFFHKFVSNLDIGYKNFEVKNLTNTDFTVHLGDFIPSNQDCYILDDKYYIRKNYVYCKENSYKLAKWKLEISDFESDNTIIRISSNLIGNMLIAPIIDFLIQFKLNEKGYSLVHASCVSKDSHAYLFSTLSGGGKTTIAMYFVEKGFDFLGDNFVILHGNNVLSFLSPLNIFTYNLTPIIKSNLGVGKMIILDLKHLLYKMTGGYAKIFTKINVRNAFSNKVVDNSKLDSVSILIPKKEFHIENISKEELINHLVINQKLELISFLDYMLDYSYMFSESNMATHWTRYKENLRKNISEDIPIYKIEVPQRYDAEVFGEILGVIEDETSAKL